MLCFHWAQIGTGAKLSPKAPKLRRFGRDLGFHSSDPFGSSFGVRFGHEIAQQLSTSWAYLGFYLGFYLRPNFGARCPHTGPSWVCWVQLARVGHKLSPSWAQVGSCSAQLHAKDCQFWPLGFCLCQLNPVSFSSVLFPGCERYSSWSDSNISLWAPSSIFSFVVCYFFGHARPKKANEAALNEKKTYCLWTTVCPLENTRRQNVIVHFFGPPQRPYIDHDKMR